MRTIDLTTQQRLDAAVDAYAAELRAFVASHDNTQFVPLIDGLNHVIDVDVAHVNPQPPPIRAIDVAVDTLADAAERLVHASVPPNPIIPPDPIRNAAIDLLANGMQTLVHVADTVPGQPQDPATQLLAGIDALAGTVGAIGDLVFPPSPNDVAQPDPPPIRELADTIALLAHDLPQGVPQPPPIRPLEAALETLADAAAGLLPTPPPIREGGALSHNAGMAIVALAHGVDQLVEADTAANPSPPPIRALAGSADALTHTVESFVHALVPSPPPIAEAPDPPPILPPGAVEHAAREGLETLADAIATLAHSLPSPLEGQGLVAAIDTAAQTLDHLLHGDNPDGPPILPAVQNLAAAVDAFVFAMPSPPPIHDADLGLDTLAHTIDALAHMMDAFGPAPPPIHDAVAGIGTLVAAVDDLIHGTTTATHGQTHDLLL